MGPGSIHTAQRFQRVFRAEARRVGDHHLGQADDGVERRAQLVAHAGEELGFVLARLRQLPALILDFVEQPHVLNRDHGLVGEGLHERPLISHGIGIFGIGLDVRDVYRSSLEGSACRDAVAARSDRVAIYEVPEFRRHVVGRHRTQKFTVKPEKERPLRLA